MSAVFCTKQLTVSELVVNVIEAGASTKSFV